MAVALDLFPELSVDILMKDIIVIGGGPSGAHFAAGAAKKGYSVALFEKGQLGREKCCAGGLSARFLRSYKVPQKQVEREIRSFVMVLPSGEKTELSFNQTAGITVNRALFDKSLVEEAIDCGCEVSFGANAVGVSIQDDKAEVKLCSGERLSAKVIIGAFGMSPQLFKTFGLQTPEFVMGLQAELPASESDIDDSIGDKIEFHFNPKYSKSGYSWVFPKRDRVAIGLVAAPASKQKKDALTDFISDYTAQYPYFRRNLPSQLKDMRFGCAMLPNNPLEKTYGNRFMLLGDAAGLIDPTTWEGIYFAFKSADLALAVFEENYGKSDFSSKRLSKYQTRWRSLFGHEIEHARSIQRRVYGDRMGKLWKLIIEELNTDDSLKRLISRELSVDMSIANMVDKVPLAVKLRLMAKYTRS